MRQLRRAGIPLVLGPVLEMGETQGFYPGEALGFAYLVVRNSAGRGYLVTDLSGADSQLLDEWTNGGMDLAGKGRMDDPSGVDPPPQPADATKLINSILLNRW